MKKTAIIYASYHHKNTETLLKNLVKDNSISLFTVNESLNENFKNFDLVGFASGIYMGKFHKSIYKFLDQKSDVLPSTTFAICTSGIGRGKYAKNFAAYLKAKGFEVLGSFECKGYDSFGIIKFFGGLSKGHPNQNDFDQCTLFLEKILQ